MRHLLIILLLACNGSPKQDNGKPVPVSVNPKPAPVVITPKHEFILNWPDRRPIGMVMIANHRSFTGNENYETNDAAQWARYCIAQLSQINAQGAVLWDGEGQKFPHPFTYIGDPRLTPEWVDSFFLVMQAAGLKTGVCLRPDEIRWIGDWPHHYTVADPLKDLADKISYAQKRWGCTLFYVDSNIGWGMLPGTANTEGYGHLIPATIFRDLAILFPDCLIMPEHQDNEYYKYTAPYNDRHYRHLLNPEEKGFQILKVDGFTVDQLRESIEQGNILMADAWYPSPGFELIKQAYEKD